MDAVVRAGYRLVYRAARVYWFIVRPRTSGAVVALWSGRTVLLIRSSYRPHYGFPGGFVGRGEAPADAAARELFEETRLRLAPVQLNRAWHGVLRFESREDTITIFEAALEPRPDVRANGREVVWAGWKTRDEALALQLLPHVRDYLARLNGPRGEPA
jgi:8-oxo-dGTP diphosphatase